MQETAMFLRNTNFHFGMSVTLPKQESRSFFFFYLSATDGSRGVAGNEAG